MSSISSLRSVLKSQYHAALVMLREAIERCPEEEWLNRDRKNAFWQVAYHVLFFTHLYLQRNEAAFVLWSQHHGQLCFRCQPGHIMSATFGPSTRHPRRRLPNPQFSRRRRHGRSVPRARHQVGARHRVEGVADGVHRGRRSRGALQARSAAPGRSEPSAHRDHLRVRRRRPRPGARARIGGRRDARRSPDPRPAPSGRGADYR